MTILKYDAIVIGAGPAGATVATNLAGEGLKTLVLEKSNFPRFQVGESLLPATMNILENLGVLDQMESEFLKKPGGRWLFDMDPIDGSFTNCEEDASFAHRPYALMVERAKFDQILADHASSVGADLRFNSRVTNVINTDDGVEGVNFISQDQKFAAHAPIVFDCSGKSNLISKAQDIPTDITDRRMAIFTHVETDVLSEKMRDGWFVGEMIHDGWLWFIPLSAQKISVGLIVGSSHLPMNSSQFKEMFLKVLSESKAVKENIGSNYRFVMTPQIRSNFNYTLQKNFGNGWISCGDSGFFVDPCWSSGVHFAMATAWEYSNNYIRYREQPAALREANQKTKTNFEKQYKAVKNNVDIFYLCSRNYLLRKLLVLSMNQYSLRKLSSFLGGDFEKNQLLMTSLYHIYRVMNRVFPFQRPYQNRIVSSEVGVVLNS